jgi:hypothetical protein
MVTMLVDRDEIRSVDALGGKGPVIAMAQQKWMAFTREVTSFADRLRLTSPTPDGSIVGALSIAETCATVMTWSSPPRPMAGEWTSRSAMR